MKQVFTIDRLPREDGFSLMAELAAKNSVPYKVTATDRSRPMTYELSHQDFGKLSVDRVTVGNHRAVRSEALAREQSDPRLILQIPEKRVLTEQCGHQVTGARGSVVAMWSLSPLLTEIPQEAALNAVTIPLDDLALPHRFLRDLVGRDLGTASFAATFSAYLDGLVRSDLGIQEQETLAGPTVDLVRVLLASAAGDEFIGREPLGRTIGGRIMLHLRTHLADPDLTPDSVAARFSISRRYLYVILNRMGVSFGEWVRTERLAAAATALRDPVQSTASVAGIARRVGFADHSTFSRAFRAEYGATPTQWRGDDSQPSSSG